MGTVRIALVTTELGVGGAEQCLTHLATGLDRNRFAPEVYSLAATPDPKRSRLIDLLKQASIPVHYVGVQSPWEFRHAIVALTRLFQEQQPRIVQTFLFHANVVGTLAARRAAVPVIVQGVRVADPRRWRHWLERIAARHARRVICVSQSVANFVRRDSRVSAEKVVVIPNGIDLDRLDNVAPVPLTELGLPAHCRAITCVARLDRQKGLDWLLKAVPKFLDKSPDHVLVLVGDGPVRESLQIQVRELGIGGRVHMVGWRDDVIGILKSSDLFVLPSRWEGMPNALIEAMACRLPIVATRVEGVEEIVGCHADSQLVPFGDTAALVESVSKILADPTLARKLGNANHDHVATHFTLTQMIRAYGAVYSMLLGHE